jgi:serine O-acetyltransferase
VPLPSNAPLNGDNLSDTRRFFFVHLMKTAGTSFVFQLNEQFGENQVYPSGGLDRRNDADFAAYVSIRRLTSLTPERRAAIRMYTGHYPYVASKMLGIDVQTLTLLRDPVDRTISVLKHFKRLSKRYRTYDVEAIYDEPFVFAHFIENHQTRMFGVTAEDKPEAFGSTMDYWSTAWMLGIGNPNYDPNKPPEIDAETAIAAAQATKVDDDRFAIAKRHLEEVDVLGLVEQYDDFIAELRNRFGWWPGGIDTNKRANRSHEAWTESAALRKRIEADNPFDMAFYEHAKEIVSSRAPARTRSRSRSRSSVPPERVESKPPTRGGLRKEIRARHPRFVEAVVADARVTAGYRSERSHFRNRADALVQVLRLMYVSDAFLAQVLYRGKARLQSLGVPVIPRILHRYAMSIAQVCIGDPVVVQPGIYLAHGQVVIDGLVEIGRGAVIFPWVTIGLRAGNIRGPVIGRNVHIGTGAKVIGPVTVHRDARVGANSVVVHDVAAGHRAVQEHLVEEQCVARFEGWSHRNGAVAGALDVVGEDLDLRARVAGAVFENRLEPARKDLETGRVGPFAAARERDPDVERAHARAEERAVLMPRRCRSRPNASQGALLDAQQYLLSEVLAEDLRDRGFVERVEQEKQRTRCVDCEHRVEVAIQYALNDHARLRLVVTGIGHEPGRGRRRRRASQRGFACVECGVDRLAQCVGPGRFQQAAHEQATVVHDRRVYEVRREILGAHRRGTPGKVREGVGGAHRKPRGKRGVPRSHGFVAEPNEPLLDLGIRPRTIPGTQLTKRLERTLYSRRTRHLTHLSASDCGRHGSSITKTATDVYLNDATPTKTARSATALD